MRKANLHHRCQLVARSKGGVIGNFLPCFAKAEITLNLSQPHLTGAGIQPWEMAQIYRISPISSIPAISYLLFPFFSFCFPFPLYSGTGMCTGNMANPWCCGFRRLARVPERCTGHRLHRKVLNSCLSFPVPSLGFLSSHCHSKKANVSLSSSCRWDPKRSDDAGSQGMWMTPWKCKSQGV